MKVRSIILLVLLALATVGCNNFFHDLIPPNENRILAFSVDGQTRGAIISENTIMVEVGGESPLHSLVPIITVSPKASLFPLTLDYLQAAFPNIDIVREAVAIYETGDIASYVIDLLKRTPGRNVPALDRPIDFSGPVDFLVVGGLGAVRRYTVHVVRDTGEPRLLGFGFSKYDNPELIRDAITVINEEAKTIQAVAIYPVDMSLTYTLVPSFAIMGDRLDIDGQEVVSGASTIPFGAILTGQTKTVTVWRNGASVDYTLTAIATQDPYSNRSIIDFRFNKEDNPQIAATAVGAITNNGDVGTITVQVFYSGSKPSTLTAKYLAPGTVTVGGVPQANGVSIQDFSQPLQYRVVSLNGWYARTYTVSVEFVNIASAAPHITSFKFSSGLNPELINDSQGQISESAGLVMLTVRYGGYQIPQTLTPEFSASGIVTVAGIVQSSGFSAQDFSRQILYTVTNPQYPQLTRDYWVQVSFSRDTSSDATITAFSFHPDENPALAEPLAGAIAQDTISVYALDGLNVTERVMIPRFVSAGTVSVNGVPQSSGVSGLIFDAPVIYTVVSANGQNRRDYTVIVRELKPTIYVDHNATGNNDGLTWHDAFTDLRLACEAATGLPADVPKELWIAKGTYKPGPNTDYYFPVAPNTSYIGGFGGWESFKSQRDKAVNPVVISGDMEKGNNNSQAAFLANNISIENVIFNDLEFRDFMLNTQDYSYLPIIVVNYYEQGSFPSGGGNIEVIGCRFSNVNTYCIQTGRAGVTFTIRDIYADNVANLVSSNGSGNFIIDNVEIVSQIQGPSGYPKAIEIYGYGFGITTISNITLQDCVDGLHVIRPLSGQYNINNINIRNLNYKRQGDRFQAVNVFRDGNDVRISNVDIDGVNGPYDSLIWIDNYTGNIVLDNVSIKNVTIPQNGTIIQLGRDSQGNTGIDTLVNNCYLEASGTSSSNSYFIGSLYQTNLIVRNTRFNFNNQNPNLMAVRALRGFNLENVSFENSVSTTLLSIDGNYPYQLKRSGSFYNGVSLSDNATFSALNARIQSTNGAVLTAVP